MQERPPSVASDRPAGALPVAGSGARQEALLALALATLAAALLALAAAAQGRGAASQSLDVNFSVNGTVSVHSMVVARDGAVLAQLGTPDMKAPISYGLAYPDRIESGASRLDFTQLGALTFEEADRTRFPGLYLSWEALRAAPGSTAVLNAANEVAVAAFLEGRLRFDAIHHVNAATLEAVRPAADEAASFEGLLALDERARAAARRHAQRLVKG